MNDKRDIVQHLKDDAAGMSKAATEQPDYYAVLGVYAMTCHEAADEIERLRVELQAVRQASHDSMWRDTLVPLAEALGVPLVESDGNKRQFQMVEDLVAEIGALRDERTRYFESACEWAKERDHLRSLITAWADACILMERTGSLDTTTPEGVVAGQALIALRKAVGR